MPPYAIPAAPMDPPEEGDVIRAGAPLEPGTPPALPEDVVPYLKDIHDPEIPVNIYDLGLIYDVTVDKNGTCRISMTLTAPACPAAGTMPMEAAEKAAECPGVGEVEVTLTWDPPWSPERMSEVAKIALDMF